MRYIEAPEVFTPAAQATRGSIFLAGGITNCPNWQKEMVELLSETNLVLLNPRRENFPIHDPDAARAQITWEFNHLRKASAILFWFPCETLCPIVLYELGAWSACLKTIFVGTHPDYARRQDVEIQLNLARGAKTVNSLQSLSFQVTQWEHLVQLGERE